MEYSEIRIQVGSEAVESVANLIHEAGAGGLVIEQRTTGLSLLTAWSPLGAVAEELLARLGILLDELSSLGIAGDYRVETTPVDEGSWAEEWKKYYHPVDLGSIVIRPSWTEYRLRPGQREVVLDPGMAFGTGVHATTQACIAELTAVVTPGCSVLDIGCGSGVLSIVAGLLGAGKVEGIDTDPVAITVANDNRIRNRCAEITSFRKGDGFDIFTSSRHQVTVANIGFRAAERLLQVYIETGREGILVLSGFPAEHLDNLSAKAKIAGVFLRGRVKNGWGVLVVKR